MKKLIVVRHAKSSWEDFQISDFDRPLNSRGLKDAPTMGKKLKELGLVPDQIICSSANRAMTTARLLAQNMGFEIEHIIENKGLYLADPDSIIRLIHTVNNTTETLMLVGHNPGLTYLINDLAGENLFNLPTCALSCIRFEIDDWKAVSSGLGRQVAYEYPKKYK